MSAHDPSAGSGGGVGGYWELNGFQSERRGNHTSPTEYAEGTIEN